MKNRPRPGVVATQDRIEQQGAAMKRAPDGAIRAHSQPLSVV